MLSSCASPRRKLGAAPGNALRKMLRWRDISVALRHPASADGGWPRATIRVTHHSSRRLASMPTAMAPAPTVAMTGPRARRPMGTIVRSHRPMAGGPRVGAVLPSPMTTDPNMHRTWCKGDSFLNHLRWFLRGDFTRRIRYSFAINHAFVNTTAEADHRHTQYHQKSFHREPDIVFLRTTVLL